MRTLGPVLVPRELFGSPRITRHQMKMEVRHPATDHGRIDPLGRRCVRQRAGELNRSGSYCGALAGRQVSESRHVAPSGHEEMAKERSWVLGIGGM